MSREMWPSRCPLDGTLLEEAASPLGGGLKVRRCPVVTCDFVTPSYKPEPKPKPRRERRRLAAAGARGDDWRRRRWDLDPDERGAR